MNEENEILKTALNYMTDMYGLELSMYKIDNDIEYSCNGYCVDRETYFVLKKAKQIISFWED